MKDLIIYIFLGFIQGFTEPIPISSSGHLLIFQKLIGSINTIDFELLATITNFGSFIAICLIYKNEIINLTKSFFKYLKTKEKKYYPNYKYSWYIVVATIPAGLLGLVVSKLNVFDFLEENVKFVGVTLIITAIFLFIIRNFKGEKTKNEMTLKNAIAIGLFQVAALLPGISRSGSTIVGSMFNNLTRETAFNFSFLLYIPISVATTVLGLKDLLDANLNLEIILLYFISMMVSLLFTYICTKWFKKIVTNGKLIYFSIYCLIVGILVIIFL